MVHSSVFWIILFISFAQRAFASGYVVRLAFTSIHLDYVYDSVRLYCFSLLLSYIITWITWHGLTCWRLSISKLWFWAKSILLDFQLRCISKRWNLGMKYFIIVLRLLLCIFSSQMTLILQISLRILKICSVQLMTASFILLHYSAFHF